MKTVRVFGVVLGCGVLAAMLWAGSALAAISGTVTDQAHAPLAGIEVCSESAGPVGGGDECALTDGAGEYTLPGVEAGHWVHFYKRENKERGYAPQWYPGVAHRSEAEAVTAAEMDEVDAVMGPGGTITGTVTDIGNGEPIEGVEICPDNIVFEEGRVTFCTRTDDEGNYALRGLETGDYRLEFRTSGDVNYVEELVPPVPGSMSLVAGSAAVANLAMIAGTEVKGTVADAATGLPIEPPTSTVSACALEAVTEAKVKCAEVGPGGHYSLAGLPPGRSYAFGFAIDGVEEGLDLHPDGYVRQYWDLVPTFAEAALFAGSGGSTESGVNAALTRGAEVWPHCELPSACAPVGEEVTPTAAPLGGTLNPIVPLVLHQHLMRARPKLLCKKGFRRVHKGRGLRCVKIHRKAPHPRHPKARPDR
jgi:hypothetical protein